MNIGYLLNDLVGTMYPHQFSNDVEYIQEFNKRYDTEAATLISQLPTLKSSEQECLMGPFYPVYLNTTCTIYSYGGGTSDVWLPCSTKCVVSNIWPQMYIYIKEEVTGKFTDVE